MTTQPCSNTSTMKHRDGTFLTKVDDRSHRAANNAVSVTLRYQRRHEQIYVCIRIMSVTGMLRNKVSFLKRSRELLFQIQAECVHIAGNEQQTSAGA
jgi:hypothetical protein